MSSSIHGYTHAMSIIWPIFLQVLLGNSVHCFWDLATTTEILVRTDNVPRQSFFRWQRTEWDYLKFWIPSWDWDDIKYRRYLNAIAGVSVDFTCLSTATILNRRTLLTSANYLDPWVTRMKDLRVWALGRAGMHYTPYRYRVWRFRRLIPKSLNPEHWHGARGVHSPRHDVAIIHTQDQMYIYYIMSTRYHYPYRATFVKKYETLGKVITYAGSGYEYLQHIRENFKIFYGLSSKEYIVNCEKYLPKWWGKFFCLINHKGYAGIQNGGGMFTDNRLIGVGCFEIRYNEDRLLVFTDLRYYYDWIHIYANISPMEYYEYAYPQWSVRLGWLYDGHTQVPFIPKWNKRDDFLPLG